MTAEQLVVGGWVRRQRARHRWHVVESTIAGAAITRCGRRMEPSPVGPGPLDATQVIPADTTICRRCVSGRRTATA